MDRTEVKKIVMGALRKYKSQAIDDITHYFFAGKNGNLVNDAVRQLKTEKKVVVWTSVTGQKYVSLPKYAPTQKGYKATVEDFAVAEAVTRKSQTSAAQPKPKKKGFFARLLG